MQKNIKILLVLSLLGIFLMLFISRHAEPQKILINNITKSMLNQQVKIAGKIISLKNFENQSFQLLTISDSSGKITATANSQIPLKLNLSKNYEIIGKIDEYNKTLQINSEKITQSSS